MIQLAVSDFGGLDIVFNNAGVGGSARADPDVEVEEWDYTFDVLAKGVFLGIGHAARAMKRLGRGGSIINTTSVAGLSGGGGPLVHSAAKAAVINLTRAAALQLAADCIRVTATRPAVLYGAHRSRRFRCCRQATRPIPAVAGARQTQAHSKRRVVPGQR